jgi:spore coat polysaccharide biosynthesis protein SpsF
MKVTAIIQARMASTRLPGKVLLDLQGKPMLLRMIERVNQSNSIDRVLVATSTDSADDAVAEACQREKIPFYRGSQDDVLERFYNAALSVQAEAVVRLTGDCPLSDPGLIDEFVEVFQSGKFDYVTNVLRPTFPDGLDLSVFSFQTLQAAHENAVLMSEREHVVPWIWKNTDFGNGTGRYRALNIEAPTDLSAERWTVDDAADFKLVSEVFAHFLPLGKGFGYRDVLDFLAIRKDLKAMNSKATRDEGYFKSLAHDKVMRKVTE